MSGLVEMEYAGMSDSGIVVRLANGTDRTIHVRADDVSPLGFVAWPSVADIHCEAVKPRPLIEHPFANVDGFYQSAEILPGERVRMKIDTKVPQQYVGGRCRLALTLEDHAPVGPLDFRP